MYTPQAGGRPVFQAGVGQFKHYSGGGAVYSQQTEVVQIFQFFPVHPVGREEGGVPRQGDHQRQGVGETKLFLHSKDIFFNRTFTAFSKEEGSDILKFHLCIVE